MNISDFLMRNSMLEKKAVKCGKQAITYVELCDRVKRRSLCIQGIKGRIGVLMDNSIEYIEVFFSIAYSDNTIVPINVKLNAREIGRICMDCNISVLFTMSKYREKVEHVDMSCRVCYVDEMDLDDGYYFDTAAIEYVNCNAIIIPTSGTTGKPKYVVHTHEALTYSIGYHSQRFIREREGKEAIVLSFCSILAEMQLLHSISEGMQIVLFSGEFDPHRLCEMFAEDNITSSAMVPAMLKMLGASAELEKKEFQSLQRIFVAGDYLCGADFELLQVQLSGVKLIQAYGMTEICPVSMKTDDDYAYKPESSGQPFPEVKVKIMNDGIEAQPGQVGVIYANGINKMSGYLGDKTLARDEFICTGDLGYIDSENYLFICGRAKNMIISSGQNIYPEEVEAVLQNCPGIKDIKVYGMKDVDRGEVVAADIVLAEDNVFNRKSFYEFCDENIAAFKIPRVIRICNEIEKNVANKKIRK